MDLQYYTDLWSEGKVARASATAFWDNRADEFNKLVSPKTSDQRIGRVLEFMSEHNLLTKNSSVLDIGCGSGGFAVEFAKTCREVTGLDISSKMLDHAHRNAAAANLTNISFEHLNWDDVNLEECGWEKRFDLVTAINSPGIHDQVTLEKMIAASKGYCLLSNFVSRSDSVQDVIRKEILQLKNPKFYVNTVYCIFNILWLMGYYPHITYVDTDREHVHSIEEASMYYGTLFELKNDPADDQNKLIKNYLEHISSDGFVRERVQTKTAWIYWKV